MTGPRRLRNGPGQERGHPARASLTAATPPPFMSIRPLRFKMPSRWTGERPGPYHGPSSRAEQTAHCQHRAWAWCGRGRRLGPSGAFSELRPHAPGDADTFAAGECGSPLRTPDGCLQRQVSQAGLASTRKQTSCSGSLKLSGQGSFILLSSVRRASTLSF